MNRHHGGFTREQCQKVVSLFNGSGETEGIPLGAIAKRLEESGIYISKILNGLEYEEVYSLKYQESLNKARARINKPGRKKKQ